MLMTTVASTKAMYLSSLPIVALFKSSSILAVLYTQIYWTHPQYKGHKLSSDHLFTAFVIGMDMVLFTFGGTEEHRLKIANLETVCLLAVSIICDGVIPHLQTSIATKPDPYELL
jgi:hypothetical protein